MKKLFTLLAISAATLATYTASAGTTVFAPKTLSQITASKPTPASHLKSVGLECNVVTNFTAADSVVTVFSDSIGILSGTGAIYGGSLFPHLNIAEEFAIPAGTTGTYVSAAEVFFFQAIINPTHADSITKVTAYVYDTTGTGGIAGYTPGFAPGNAIDSASVTLATIADSVSTGALSSNLFVFNNVPLTTGKSFFIVVGIPQITGDSIAIYTNDGTSGNGNGWLDIGPGWLTYDSLFGGTGIGNFIVPLVCGDTGTTGIKAISNVNNFSIYPNPSNGVFTASAHMSSASDVYMSITDMTGSKVYESTENAVVSMNKQINLSNMAAGVYIASIKTAEGTSVQRLVIK